MRYAYTSPGSRQSVAHRSGTITVIIPAAWAARTPLSESFYREAFGRRNMEAFSGLQKQIRKRFAAGNIVAGHKQGQMLQ